VTVLIARDAGRRPIALATSPIQSGTGPVHGAVTVLRDLSDERRLARERHEIDRRILGNQKLESLATLAGGIAQQFNNLLVVIIGNATIARGELEPGERDEVVETALDDIEAAAGRAAVLAHQMLAYGGRGRFLLTSVDVGKVIAETGSLLGVTLPASAAIRYDVEPGLPAIEADDAQIRQLLMAMLVNAAEAIGDRPGTITIAARADTIAGVHGEVAGTVAADDKAVAAGRLEGPIGMHPEAPVIVLEVTDTGHGMDEATRRQVFQPFFSTRFVGRGLGLAAALGIVRGHLGRIDVRSTPGAGSTFRVILPALDVAEPAAAAPRRAPDRS
jgi:two-component system cell cycle sensor histidine kinase/response regulator CckA